MYLSVSSWLVVLITYVHICTFSHVCFQKMNTKVPRLIYYYEIANWTNLYNVIQLLGGEGRPKFFFFLISLLVGLKGGRLIFKKKCKKLPWKSLGYLLPFLDSDQNTDPKVSRRKSCLSTSLSFKNVLKLSLTRMDNSCHIWVNILAKLYISIKS